MGSPIATERIAPRTSATAETPTWMVCLGFAMPLRVVGLRLKFIEPSGELRSLQCDLSCLEISLTSFPFEKLNSADLVIDATYEGNRNDPKMQQGSEPLHHLIPGLENAGGFRRRKSSDGLRLVALVLTSTGGEIEWPDELDPYTGVYTYYGDNRSPGKDLHDTTKRGNQELKKMFELANGDADERAKCPIILLFERGQQGRDMVFKGLAVPGTKLKSESDDLVAIWKMSQGQRFQNFRAKFTVLDTGTISGEWIRRVFSERVFNPDEEGVPPVLSDWVHTGKIKPLLAERDHSARSLTDQAPRAGLASDLIETILNYCSSDPFLFEPIAAAVWQLSCAQPIEYELTRRYRDGGRDAVGYMLLGPISDVVRVSFSLEAKCYRFPNSKVGVKEMSRLISRLKHREFGVLVTTSVVDKQAYEEVRSDGHPIVILSGQDIAEVLLKNGINDRTKLLDWIVKEHL